MVAKLVAKVKDYLEKDLQDPAWCRLSEVLRQRESMRDFGERNKVSQALVLESVVMRVLEDKEWKAQELEAQELTSRLFLDFVRKCQSLIELVSHLYEVCNNALALCKAAFVPEELSLTEGRKPEERFVFHKFDHEGRTVYRSKNSQPSPCKREVPGDVEGLSLLSSSRSNRGRELRWNEKGHWEVGPDEPRWKMASALLTDPGIWTRVVGVTSAGQSLRVQPRGKKLLDQLTVRELREIVFRGGAGSEDPEHQPTVEQVVAKTCEMLAPVFEQDPRLVQHANQLLDSLVEIARKLELKKEDGSYVMGVVSASENPQALQEKLIRLTSLAHNPVLDILKEKLPKYASNAQEGLINECKTLNCRLIDLSDLRNVEETFLPRLFHRFCLFAWQQQHPKQVMYLDLGVPGGPAAGTSLKEGDRERKLTDKKDFQVRFVVVSDTHGWDAEMELPEGDVLLHCGDVAFEARRMVAGADVPSDFLAAMELFKTPRYQKFQWIFMIPGGHDQPLFDLWSREPKKLFELLPKNLVLLQAYTDFGADGKLECSGAAKCQEHRKQVQDGAVWLYPERILANGKIELRLKRPREKGQTNRGWIIAGSGVSLQYNPWSFNRAFQLQPQQEHEKAEAAKCLMKHDPYVVMSHGPPQAKTGEVGKTTNTLWDEGRGDEQLRKELEASKSWKLVVFGHSHEHHGLVHKLEDRLFVNAAISTQLYVPMRPPIVFDLSVETAQLPREHGGGPDDPGRRPTWCGVEMCPCPFPCCGGGEAQVPLVGDWVPEHFVAGPVLEILEKERTEAATQARLRHERHEGDRSQEDVDRDEREAREGVRLSEFHASGPAVQYGFQTIVGWFVSLALTMVFYHFTGQQWAYWPFQTAPLPKCLDKRDTWREGCDAFIQYPMWLWVFFVPILIHTCWVQNKCLTYVVLPQVHALGRGFHLFGGFKLSFDVWRVAMFLWTAVCLTDITAQSLFFVQFLVSAQINQQIATVWRATIHQSDVVSYIPRFDDIIWLFTWCFLMTLLQAGYIVLHLFPTHDEGVSYACGSMRQGYTTVASSLFWFEVDYEVDSTGRDAQSKKRSRRKYWHADILRILACYGRMPALVWEESSLLWARLEMERAKGNLVRYLQILFNRQHDFLFRLVLLDIFEAAVKLEIQISVFAIDMALQAFKIANRQMCFAIIVSFVNVVFAVESHKQMLGSLWSVTMELDRINWQNREEGERNLKRFKRWRWYYTFWLIVLVVIFFHCLVKFVMAFSCEFSLSKNIIQCAVFDFNGTRNNRTLNL